MRTISILITFLAMSVLTSWGGGLDQRADSAYMADQFAEAAGLYEQAAREEGVSSALYYNLGNSYYRMGRTGEAIVAYERALRLDPSNSEAKANLEFLNSRIIDRPGDRGSFISNTLDEIALYTSTNNWAWVAVGLFAIVIVCGACYLFSSVTVVRKAGFFGGIVMLLLCVTAVVFSFRAASISSSRSAAVIVVPSTILSTSPRTPKDRNEEAMLLHEGTKVEILDSVTTRVDSTEVKWYDVQVDNNHRAWIEGTAIQRI